MEHLPEEVVSEVFQYLDQRDLGQMSSACQSWKSMAENEVLLSHIHSIELEGKDINNAHNLTRGIRSCDKLILKKCSISSKKLCSIIREIGLKLKSIQLIDCSITDPNTQRIFQCIADNCPQIESIEFLTTNLKLNMINEEFLEPLLKCPNLHTLKIDGLDIRDFSIISQLATKIWNFEFTTMQNYQTRKIEFNLKTNCFVVNDQYHGYSKQLFPQVNDNNPPYLPSIHPAFHDSILSVKFNTYEIIDISRDGTCTLIDESGATEEHTPSADVLKEIEDDMEENGECFISLIKIQETDLNSTSQINSTIENGTTDRPPFW